VISLLDTANKIVVDLCVVFRNLPTEFKHSPLWKLLKPGFEHVEVWRCDRGVWVRIDPCLEYMMVEAYVDPPWALLDPALSPTYFKTTRLIEPGKVREPFLIGPITCVELAKAALGIRSAFVRTPWQLHNYLVKNERRR
jgi:hypothetical protein